MGVFQQYFKPFFKVAGKLEAFFEKLYVFFLLCSFWQPFQWSLLLVYIFRLQSTTLGILVGQNKAKVAKTVALTLQFGNSSSF